MQFSLSWIKRVENDFAPLLLLLAEARNEENVDNAVEQDDDAKDPPSNATDGSQGQDSRTLRRSELLDIIHIVAAKIREAFSIHLHGLCSCFCLQICFLIRTRRQSEFISSDVECNQDTVHDHGPQLGSKVVQRKRPFLASSACFTE